MDWRNTVIWASNMRTLHHGKCGLALGKGNRNQGQKWKKFLSIIKQIGIYYYRSFFSFVRAIFYTCLLVLYHILDQHLTNLFIFSQLLDSIKCYRLFTCKIVARHILATKTKQAENVYDLVYCLLCIRISKLDIVFFCSMKN